MILKSCRHIVLYALLFVVISISSCSKAAKEHKVASPDGNIAIEVFVKEGVPYYTVAFKGSEIIAPSRLGFEVDQDVDLKDGLSILNSEQASYDETWTQPWGEVKDIREHYNSLKVNLARQGSDQATLKLEFRVFDDGVGFRYIIPEQEGLPAEYKILNELTEFNFKQDYSTWWIPAYDEEMDYEHLFYNNPLREIKDIMHTPVTMNAGDSLFVSIHEAALVDYTAMTLKPTGQGHLVCELVPWSTGEKVRAEGAVTTPWRTLQIGQRAGDLITSYLILNLNEPNKLGDVSWIKPGKYDGSWWGMHIKEQTWEMGPQHGASTDRVKKLIDFASDNNLSAVLVEGWNQGWEAGGAIGDIQFAKPFADFDIAFLSDYAHENGVDLVLHHETGGNVINYESQLDDALRLFDQYDIHYLKTGYVADKANGKEYHQGQYMVNHYNKVMKETAAHHIMLDVHEPVKATGLRRTYPNMMTREGARGTEYEAWSDGNPPSHTTILPFTRCLAGPLDYTPGIFDIMIENRPGHRVHTTLAKQLALYVVIYSPLNMVADLPEHYEGNPAFQFLRDVPTDWADTKVPEAEIGSYVTIVRKDRNSDDWYLGSITNEEGRTLKINLDFLDEGAQYEAQVYADGENASMEDNPLSIDIFKKQVNNKDQLELTLAPGGGQAIRFRKIN